jgi:hypothetical protein
MFKERQTILRHPEFRGRIGVARLDITPPLGIHSRTWGSAKHDVAEGVHRPLLATCVALRELEGDGELVLITLDALVFWPLAADKIRASVESRFGLQRHQVIFHPSHSHSAPFLAVRQLEKAGGDKIVPYLDTVSGVCCDLVAQARATATESIIGWAYGHCGLAFNRDAIDPASGRDVCGLNLREPADDTLLVGRITDTAGHIKATLVNYACHPVSLGGGNRLLSPDYVGAMREIVERDSEAPCVFLHGASGDLTPRRSYEANVEAADQNGRELGYAALSTLASMLPPGQQLAYAGIEESGTPLGTWKLQPKPSVNGQLRAKVVTTRLKVKDMPTRSELKAQLAVAKERYQIEVLERALGRRDQVGDEPENDFSFMVCKIGDAFMVSTPAEAYSRFQTDLRQKFPQTAVAVLNLSDGTTTYLPKPSAFKSDVYQVRVALYEIGSLDNVTRAATDAIAAIG